MQIKPSKFGQGTVEIYVRGRYAGLCPVESLETLRALEASVRRHGFFAILAMADEGQGSVAVDARLVLRQDDGGEPCFQPLRSRTGQISSVPVDIDGS